MHERIRALSKKKKKSKARKKSPAIQSSNLESEGIPRPLLEQFTTADLRQWKQISAEHRVFTHRQFFDLDAQRIANYKILCDSLQNVPSITVNLNRWVRVVNFKYSLNPLSAKGSITWVGGRFNIGKRVNSIRFPPFGALYIAEDAETAYREYFALKANETSEGLSRKELALKNNVSYSNIYVKGSIDNVFDLTKSKNLKAFIGITKNFEITDDIKEHAKEIGLGIPRLIKTADDLKKCLLEQNWRRFPTLFDLPSNSQVFGKMLYDSGFEGVLYKSTKCDSKCLAVFIDNFKNSTSIVEIAGEHPEEIKNTILNSDTYEYLK